MRRIGFIAGEHGIVKYDPKQHAPVFADKPKALTVHQRATLYFKALRYISTLFKEVGFKSIGEDSHTWFTLEMGQFILDMKVEKPPMMAHVTSYPGYVYDPNKIAAKVTNLSPAPPGEYVIRVTAAINMHFDRPTYVVVDKDSVDPLRDAFKSALAAAASFIEKDRKTFDKIRAAMAERDLEKDFERFQESVESNQLPESTDHSMGY
jgi:hypothetical protein